MSDIIDAEPGEHIDLFAKELRTIARARNAPVQGRHNDRVITANPGSTLHEIISQWHKQGK